MHDSIFFAGQDDDFEDVVTNRGGNSEDESENLTRSEQLGGQTTREPINPGGQYATKPP